MARKRDYAAEYARRVARGAARGFTRQQARGHPAYGQRYVSGKTKPPIPAGTHVLGRQGEALRLMREEGRSLSAAARATGVAPERLRAFVRQNPAAGAERAGAGIMERHGGRWVATWHVTMLSGGDRIPVSVRREDASRIGHHWNAVKAFLLTNDPSHLQPFRRQSVRDLETGRRRRFETNPAVLRKMDAAGTATPGKSLYVEEDLEPEAVA